MAKTKKTSKKTLKTRKYRKGGGLFKNIFTYKKIIIIFINYNKKIIIIFNNYRL